MTCPQPHTATRTATHTAAHTAIHTATRTAHLLRRRSVQGKEEPRSTVTRTRWVLLKMELELNNLNSSSSWSSTVRRLSPCLQPRFSKHALQHTLQHTLQRILRTYLPSSACLPSPATFQHSRDSLKHAARTRGWCIANEVVWGDCK